MPASIDRVIIVFVSRAEPPFEPCVLAWLDRHAGEPLRGKVRRWVEERRLRTAIADASQIPLPAMGACFAKTMDPSAVKRCGAARQAVVVQATEPSSGFPVGLWALTAAGRALAAAFGGAVFDQARRCFWRTGLADADLPADGAIAVADHIMVLHSIDTRGLAWFTTLGLSQFGLPDLEVRDVPPNLGGRLVPLVNGVAQVLVEGVIACAVAGRGDFHEIQIRPEIRVSSADAARALRRGDAGDPGKQGLVRLEYSERGLHAPGPFLTLRPPRGFERNAGVWLNDVLGCFAPRDENVVYIDPEDQDLSTAHRRAVAELAGVKERFQRGLGVGSELHVKRGFAAEDGGIEYMWVAVTTWKGSRIQGHLISEPQLCPDLRAGDPVDLGEAEVYDWLLEHPDGTHEGGYTQDVLLRGRG